jgi:hypothetical protein
MDKSRKQNIDMPRTHQKTELLRDRLFIGKIEPHISAGDGENNKKDNAECKMCMAHSCIIRIASLSFSGLNKSNAEVNE